MGDDECTKKTDTAIDREIERKRGKAKRTERAIEMMCCYTMMSDDFT